MCTCACACSGYCVRLFVCVGVCVRCAGGEEPVVVEGWQVAGATPNQPVISDNMVAKVPSESNWIEVNELTHLGINSKIERKQRHDRGPLPMRQIAREAFRQPSWSFPSIHSPGFN